MSVIGLNSEQVKCNGKEFQEEHGRHGKTLVFGLGKNTTLKGVCQWANNKKNPILPYFSVFFSSRRGLNFYQEFFCG